MVGEAFGRKKVGIVMSILNEERNIRDLMDSLIVQEPPLEIVVVDAGSWDKTVEYVNGYAKQCDFIRVFHHPGTRGESMNFGLRQTNADIVTIVGGDTIANPFWLHEMRKSLESVDIVAGRTINMGYRAFEDLGRVELERQGSDISYPGCNIGYRREVIETVKEFDPWFISAEDIDFNMRAVDSGYKINYNDDMVIYHRTRGTIFGFIKQAFWNGYGRKQLTMKHGKLWSHYDPRKMFDRNLEFWALLRLAAAFLGYGYARFNAKLPKERNS